LESPRDVRILIAQDATGSQGKAVLYDSNPSQTSSPKPHAAFCMPEHSQPLSSAGIASAGFLRARRRGTLPTSNPADVYQSQHAGFIKPEDEIKVLTDCMFGAAPLSYKGSSTKVHIIPTVGKTLPKSPNTSPTIGDGQGSFGRAEGRRRSHLAQSYTPNNPPPGTRAANTSNPFTKAHERKTVLVTRLFSIAIQPVPTLEGRDHTPTPGNSVGSTHSFPFPRMTGATAPAPSKLSKAPRTAMYAIGLILQLPSPTHSTLGTASRSGHPQHHNRRMSNSSNGHDIFPSSFESDNRIGSMFTDPSFGFEASLPVSGDGDDRMEIIAQHWDVITRTLSALQSITQEQIVESLRQAELAAPQYAVSVSRTRRTVELWPGALIDDEIIKKAVESARLRVVLGLRIPRVVTGQGRWGVWREEARWVGRWAGGKEQNFFFFNLLTAFLGNHNEWLEALGPPWYRRRQQRRQRASSNEDLAVPSRTVILATDKMAARRLIFLLSAFLPATSSSGDSLSPYRPVTSSSRGYSQSPPMPSFMRKESLRRTINKRANVSRNNAHSEGPKFSASLHGSPPEDSATVVNNGPHSRRPSDTSSIRSKNLPIPNNTGATSATTTTTVTPATTVPHFSTHRADSFTSGTAAEPRPGSSGSLASLNLMHTLKRNNSTNYSGHSTDSGTGSLWGSLISGFWSNRRYSSTEVSVATTAADEGLGISGVHRPKFSSPTTSSTNKLDEMVAKSHGSVEGELYHHELDEETAIRTRVPSLDQNTDSTQIVGTPPSQAIPAPGRILESPLKLSVDENDGVVDVDIQLPGFLNASLGSPMGSPSTAGFMSVASLDGGASSFGHTSACPFSGSEQESPVNVAGWLKKYHADFALQAVSPYLGLEEEIKHSMKAEPTPSLASLTPSAEGGPIDKWIDVSTVLIADTRNFSITRIRLKRRVNLAAADPPASPPLVNESALPARSQYGNPYSQSQANVGIEILDGHLEEKWIEEPIMDMDGTLVDAVEKIIAQSHCGSGHYQPQHPSTALDSMAPGSNASSRSSSCRRGRRITRADSGMAGLAGTSTPTLEIPRGECKNTVIGALEEVVRSVAHDNDTKKKEDQQQQQQPEQPMKGVFGSMFRKNVEVESTLREGVRKWLRDVELGP
jgi:Folliculin-interacting protein N-terminus